MCVITRSGEQPRVEVVKEVEAQVLVGQMGHKISLDEPGCGHGRNSDDIGNTVLRKYRE